jgi:hypothetical protein
MGAAFLFWLLLSASLSSAEASEQLQRVTSGVAVYHAADEREAGSDLAISAGDLTLAREILARSEGANNSDTTSHALLLYRIAGAWTPIDISRARSLYSEAFVLARQSTTAVRVPLENAILNELLPISPDDVTNLLPTAEIETQNRLLRNLVMYWLYRADYSKAIDAFEASLRAGRLPGDPAVHLMATLTKISSDQRNRITDELIHFCSSHPDNYDYLAVWVARFYTQLPPPLVSDAIRTVLTDAELEDRRQPLQQINQFHSIYDLELFKVSSALQQVDSNRAAELIAEHDEVREALKQYPKGIESSAAFDFSLDYSITPNNQKPMDLRVWSRPSPGDALNLDAPDEGLELTTPLTYHIDVTGSHFDSYDYPNGPEVAVLDQLKLCPQDLPLRLEISAQGVPIVRTNPIGQATYPRVELFLFIAEGCIHINVPASAQSALQSSLKIVQQIPAQDRVDFIARAADLYLRLGDRDAAYDVVQEEFDLALSLYKQDSASDKLKAVPAGFWDAAEVYRRMITLGVHASLNRTRKAVDEIPDASLRAIENVMIARTLLGVPVRRRIIVPLNGRIEAYPGFNYGDVFR